MVTLAILNFTPDSFSDGAEQNLEPQWALERAEALLQVADFLDIGAESTRPTAETIDSQVELNRLLPFLEAWPSLRATAKQSSGTARSDALDCFVVPPCNDVLSLDSRKPEVIEQVFKEHGNKFAFLNDVTGLQNPDLLKVVAEQIDPSVKLICMHSKAGVPPIIRAADVPDDFYEQGLLEELKRFWSQTIELCSDYGIEQERLIFDPGLGFGKNLQHSLEIIDLIPQIKEEFGLPVLIGASRKSFLKLWKNSPQASNEELDLYTKEYNQLAIAAGADYLRNHS
ncbi:MAG: dihydropteroate synthase [Candidatus Melainabacteria bacterium]|nr:dihydropteroate synthase [Candidatus Melainabacteria bacterium]